MGFCVFFVLYCIGFVILLQRWIYNDGAHVTVFFFCSFIQEYKFDVSKLEPVVAKVSDVVVFPGSMFLPSKALR